MERTIPITRGLTGKTDISDNIDASELGRILSRQATVQFLQDNYQQIPYLFQTSLKDIVVLTEKIYRWKLQGNGIEGSALPGTVGKVKVTAWINRFLSRKIHSFFSQGRTITACLTKEGPHLNDRGESTCTILCF